MGDRDSDQEWKPFDPSPEEASWFVFEESGKVGNESLKEFEREKVELVVVEQEKKGEEGDQVLGVSSFLFVLSPRSFLCNEDREN
jgi:hypothetical protein